MRQILTRFLAWYRHQMTAFGKWLDEEYDPWDRMR
jgi:hypothetical protein